MPTNSRHKDTDMTPEQIKMNQIANAVIARYDWDEVAAQFKANNWTWQGEKDTPTAARLRGAAEHMAFRMVIEDGSLQSSGNLTICKTGPSLDSDDFTINLFIGMSKWESESGYDHSVKCEAFERSKGRDTSEEDEDRWAGADEEYAHGDDSESDADSGPRFNDGGEPIGYC